MSPVYFIRIGSKVSEFPTVYLVHAQYLNLSDSLQCTEYKILNFIQEENTQKAKKEKVKPNKKS